MNLPPPPPTYEELSNQNSPTESPISGSPSGSPTESLTRRRRERDVKLKMVDGRIQRDPYYGGRRRTKKTRNSKKHKKSKTHKKRSHKKRT